MKNTKSSKKVYDFLVKNNLHKKDFAQMAGVTLSYVYNIIDDNSPFSTRSTTIERIAVIMDVLPEDFEEYVIEQDPVPFNKNLEKIKDLIKKRGLTTVEFLKLLERKRRLYAVDILRGALPVPVDIGELKALLAPVSISSSEFFTLWRDVMEEALKKLGFNLDENRELLDKMFLSVKDFF